VSLTNIMVKPPAGGCDEFHTNALLFDAALTRGKAPREEKAASAVVACFRPRRLCPFLSEGPGAALRYSAQVPRRIGAGGYWERWWGVLALARGFGLQ
jgi:hypothetical protein